MTKEQIKNWVKNEIKAYPEVAEEYKKQRLARLQVELRDNQRAFDREGYMSYRDPEFGSSIVRIKEEIKNIEHKTAEEVLEEVLIYDFTERYALSEAVKESIKFIKHLSEEDHYIGGLFKDTKYSYIWCKADFDNCKADFDNEAGKDCYKKICAMYKKGLSKRDEYIKIGAKFHQEWLTKNEKELLQLENIDKSSLEKIQEMIDHEISLKKQFCRSLAQMSVVDAFDKMGAHPEPKQAEKIERIIELHDPNAVESAIQTMIDNPTENMCALMRNIIEAPEESRKELRAMKALEITSLVVGGILTSLGIVEVATGSPSLITMFAMGAFHIGFGFIGMLRNKRKTDNLDQKDVLVLRCIDDLLNQVVLEETFNKELER